MVRKRIQLVEFGTPRLVELTVAEADAIREVSLRWKRSLGLAQIPITVLRAGDRYEIRARYVTGFIPAGDVDLEIAPKFLEDNSEDTSWRRALWNILALIDEAPAIDSATAADVTALTSFTDLMAQVFLASIERGRARGSPRGYVSVEAAQPVLRGRLNTGRMIDLITRPWELPCVFDLYDADIPLNRLLRWAAEQLQQTVRASSRARVLNECAYSFGKVRAIPPPLQVAERLTLGPQQQALSSALQIARVLLRGRLLEHGPSAHELSGFLWKGQDVFEAFVLRLAGRAASRLVLHAQKKAVRFGDPLDGGSPLNSTPDVRILRGSETCVVLDAKYKLYSGQPRADDSYQVVAAAKALNCAETALVFPKSASDLGNHSWTIVGSGNPKRLSTLSLDLTVMADLERETELVNVVQNFLEPRIAATTAPLAA
jgi:5-methylcytosine-specific restriction endonuclease McrBC regulatory subunit McrC